MPTYSYRCSECGTAFDIQQAFTDDSLTECPTCGGLLRKVFSPVGISFSGSGFYRNDSRAAEKSSSSSNGASNGDTGTKTSADTKTEKPAPAAAASAPASSGSSAPSSS